MQKSKAPVRFALTFLAIALCTAGIARAQYTVVGTTAGGGEIITGSGVLGPLSNSSVPVSLSAGGFDQVTLLPGAFASTNGSDTIVFITSHDVFLNSGTVQGGAGSNPLTFLSGASLTGESITNYGLLINLGPGVVGGGIVGGNTAGSNLTGGNVGSGLNITSGIVISFIGIANTGTIVGVGPSVVGGGSVGGNFSAVSNNTGGNVAGGIDITSGSTISGVTIINSGVVASSGINTIGGGVTGGNYNGASFAGGNVDSGVGLTSLAGAISSIAITNTGTIAGGSINTVGGGATGGNYNGSSDAGGNVGDGLDIVSGAGALSAITITNSGVITGGSVQTFGGGVIAGNHNGPGFAGGNADGGIELTSLTGAISSITIANTGTIQGGGASIAVSTIGGNYSGNNAAGGNVGGGIDFTSGSAISAITITNGGLIAGGFLQTAGGAIGGNHNGTPYVGGNVGSGINFTATTGISGISISNKGTITGGGIGTMGGGAVGGNYSSSNVLGGDVDGGIDFISDSSISAIAIANSGTITGGSIGAFSNGQVGGNSTGSGLPGGDIGSGIDFANVGANASGILILNQGLISGGGIGSLGIAAGGNSANGNVGGNVGGGIDISTNGQASGIAIASGGAITGGTFGTIGASGILAGNTTGGNIGGNAGSGIDISSAGSVTGVSIANGGAISGGVFGAVNGGSIAGDTGGGSVGGNAGGGIELTASGSLNGISFANQGSISGGSFGAVTGGNVAAENGGGLTGHNAGGGIELTSNGNIGGISLVNQGTITGAGFAGIGTSGFVGGNTGGGNTGGNVASGIELTTTGNVGTVSFANSGTISGGAFGPASAGTVGGNSGGGLTGANVGVAIAITNNGGISGVTILNQGAIAGGGLGNVSGGNVGGNTGGGNLGGNVGVGVELNTTGAVSGVTLINTGAITGGNVGNVSAGSVGGNTGGGLTGGNVGNGVDITASGVISGVSIFNAGSITGGNVASVSGGSVGGNTGGGLAGGMVGSGINLSTLSAGSNITITNFGTVTGGNAGAGANAGNGISSNAGNLVINNWGAISTGAGANPVAINLQTSTNNTVNLNGHSSVNGLISNAGAANGSVLNLNFTGLSPAAIANLKAQFAAQGISLNTGVESSGVFTVRGVNYIYDPLAPFLNVSSYQLQGRTPNQQAIGASLDSATVNPPPGSPLFNLFNAIDLSGNVPGALEALSPQKYEIYGDLAIQNSTAMVQNVDARLNNLRDGSESVDTTGAGGGVTSGAITTGDPSKDGGGKETKEIVQPAPQEKRWGFFATGNGLFFRGNSHNVDLQEGKSNSAGTLIGVDGKVGEHGVIGALFAYNNSDVTLGGDGSHATIESYSGGLYGSYHNEGFYVNGLGAYTRNNYDSMRNIMIPGFGSAAGGSTNGNQATVNLDGGYDFHVTDRLTAGPLAGVQYVHLDVDGFNETGAGAAGLAINSQSMDSLQSRVGGRLDYHIATTATSSFAAELYAAWEHEYLNDSRAISAGFEGSGLAPFSIQTASPKRDAAVVGLGLNFTFHDRLTLFTDYELQLWRASYFEQTINGGAKISF